MSGHYCRPSGMSLQKAVTEPGCYSASTQKVETGGSPQVQARKFWKVSFRSIRVKQWEPVSKHQIKELCVCVGGGREREREGAFLGMLMWRSRQTLEISILFIKPPRPNCIYLPHPLHPSQAPGLPEHSVMFSFWLGCLKPELRFSCLHSNHIYHCILEL